MDPDEEAKAGGRTQAIAVLPLAKTLRNELAQRKEPRGEILAALLVIVGVETGGDPRGLFYGDEDGFIRWASDVLRQAFESARRVGPATSPEPEKGTFETLFALGIALGALWRLREDGTEASRKIASRALDGIKALLPELLGPETGEPVDAELQRLGKAALETTHIARMGKVCAAQSLEPGPLGVFCYCTRERAHEGEHMAKTAAGELVAVWT